MSIFKDKAEHKSRGKLAIAWVLVPLSTVVIVAALANDFFGGLLLVGFVAIWFYFGRMWSEYGGLNGLLDSTNSYIRGKK